MKQPHFILYSKIRSICQKFLSRMFLFYRLFFRSMRFCMIAVPYLFIVLLNGQAVLADTENLNKPILPDLNSIEVLDLETASWIAIAGNPSLAAALERVKQSKQRVLQARARYWPRLDANASGTRVRLSDNAYDANLASARTLNPFAEIQDPENYYSADLTASLILFDGFDRLFTNLAAKYGKEQSEYAHMDTKRLLLYSVARSYFSAQLALKNIEIAEADKTFNQRQLKEAKARRRVGTGSLSDELNFKIRVNSAEAELIKAKQSYKATLFGLAALLGLPEASFPINIKLARLLPENPNEMSSPEPVSLIEYALSNRPDVLQTEFTLKKASSEIGSARAGFYPSIKLSASIDGDRTENARFENDDYGKSVNLVFTYNLFSGGSDLARVREAKSRKRESEKSMENIKLQISADVRSAVTELESAQQQLLLQRENAELVQRNRDLTEKEYAAGQGSLVRLNEAQRDLVTAQSRLALALVSLHDAWYNLETDTGKILKFYE